MKTSENVWYNECQRVTTNGNEWKRVVQQVRSSDNEWQPVIISATFPFFRVREEPTSKHSKENSINLEEDLEEGLLD